MLGLENNTVAALLNNLGGFFYCFGDYGNAIKNYQQVLDINNKLEKKRSLDHAVTLSNLAELYRVMGKYKEAIPLYKSFRNHEIRIR